MTILFSTEFNSSANNFGFPAGECFQVGCKTLQTIDGENAVRFRIETREGPSGTDPAPKADLVKSLQVGTRQVIGVRYFIPTSVEFSGGALMGIYQTHDNNKNPASLMDISEGKFQYLSRNASGENPIVDCGPVIRGTAFNLVFDLLIKNGTGSGTYCDIYINGEKRGRATNIVADGDPGFLRSRIGWYLSQVDNDPSKYPGDVYDLFALKYIEATTLEEVNRFLGQSGGGTPALVMVSPPDGTLINPDERIDLKAKPQNTSVSSVEFFKVGESDVSLGVISTPNSNGEYVRNVTVAVSGRSTDFYAKSGTLRTENVTITAR